MAWLDRLLGVPTMPLLMALAQREMRALGMQALAADHGRAEISATDAQGRQHRFNLHNLYARYEAAPRSQRQALVRHHIQSLVAVSPASDGNYPSARPHLLAVVRCDGDFMAADPARRHDTVARRPLPGGMDLRLVVDQPAAMTYITTEQLQVWGISLDQALQDALDNLRALPEHGGWQPLFPGVWSGQWGDVYESSRILLPDLIYRLGVHDPVIMVPYRNAIMVTSASNTAGIANMLDAVSQTAESTPHWVSFTLLQLQGSQLVAFQPPGALAAAAASLQRLYMGTRYAGQLQELEALHEAADADILVAAYDEMSLADGQMVSYAVWPDDIEALIPLVDVVAFAYTAGGQMQHFLVPWPMACQVAGHLMEPTIYQPPRYRVRAFPDAAMQLELRHHQLQPRG